MGRQDHQFSAQGEDLETLEGTATEEFGPNLPELLNTGGPSNWTVSSQKVFDLLKEAMCSAPILIAPDYSKTFIVQTDSSEIRIGAILPQLNDEGQDQPVAFISRRLLLRETRWSAIEREAFAVVWSLKKLGASLFKQTTSFSYG